MYQFKPYWIEISISRHFLELEEILTDLSDCDFYYIENAAKYLYSGFEDLRISVNNKQYHKTLDLIDSILEFVYHCHCIFKEFGDFDTIRELLNDIYTAIRVRTKDESDDYNDF